MPPIKRDTVSDANCLVPFLELTQGMDSETQKQIANRMVRTAVGTALFMVIIGGLGSIFGNYLGAILIVAVPVILNTVPEALGLDVKSATVEHINVMIVGALIIFFLIVEPHGLARLWQIIREKLIIWPFPH